MSSSHEIDRLLEQTSDLVEGGDYREARRILHGIQASHPSPEQLTDTERLLQATGPDSFAYAMTAIIAVFLLIVAVLIFK